MRITNNIMAMNTFNMFQLHYREVMNSFAKLSTGLRITKAADDPAGLAISERMRAQIRGLNQATRNAQDGISLLNVADGALNETHTILQKIRELSVQAANDTLTGSDKVIIQNEIDALVDEVDRIADQTQFNTRVLFGNTPFSGVLHIGANKGQTMNIAFRSMRSNDLGIQTMNVSTNGGAESAIEAVDEAIRLVSVERGRVGASTNRLEHVINVNSVTAENTVAAESRIRDVDMAQEMMKLSKHMILMQFAQALMAQTNQYPSMILQLLRQL